MPSAHPDSAVVLQFRSSVPPIYRLSPATPFGLRFLLFGRDEPKCAEMNNSVLLEKAIYIYAHLALMERSSRRGYRLALPLGD